MPTRPLADTRVSAIGFGVMGIGGYCYGSDAVSDADRFTARTSWDAGSGILRTYTVTQRSSLAGDFRHLQVAAAEKRSQKHRSGEFGLGSCCILR